MAAGAAVIVVVRERRRVRREMVGMRIFFFCVFSLEREGMMGVGWREGVGGAREEVDGRSCWCFGRVGMEAGVFFQE